MSNGVNVFIGEVVTRWLTEPDGAHRNMELTQPFAFIDPSGKRWEAAAGRVVNGASIPGVLWNSVGPPYVGNYRRATVLHDVACEDKTEPYLAVHRMFYDAMRADGVSRTRAFVMYQAVRRFGPSWQLGPAPAMAATAFTAAEPATIADMDRLEAASERALDELGPTASLDDLDSRVDTLFPN